MGKDMLEDLSNFRKIISHINSELKTKNIFEIEYLLINNSVLDVLNLLNEVSDKYSLIKDDCYLDTKGTFGDFFKCYCEYVKIKYESLMIKEGMSDKVADNYMKKSKEPVGNYNSGFIQYEKTDIGIIQTEAEKTIQLLKEAVIAYYGVYYNKELIAELITGNINNNNYLEFKIRESELLHLLGISANQLRNNPDFIKLTGNKNMSSLDILEWIVSDSEGNKDLLQYSEDFLKRMDNNKFAINKEQFSNNTSYRLLNYYKIKLKSQTFLKYGPFEQVSLVAKLANNKKLAQNSKSNTAMITKPNIFNKYPWAYFGNVQGSNDNYMETLVLDSSENKKELFKEATPAIVTGVYVLGEEGNQSEGIGGHIFSEEEQLNLFLDAYDAFHTTIDFSNLIKYFKDLSFDKNNNRGTIHRL